MKTKQLNAFSLYQVNNMLARYSAFDDDISILAYIRYNPSVKVLDATISTRWDQKEGKYVTIVKLNGTTTKHYTLSKALAAHQHVKQIALAAHKQHLL